MRSASRGGETRRQNQRQHLGDASLAQPSCPCPPCWPTLLGNAIIRDRQVLGTACELAERLVTPTQVRALLASPRWALYKREAAS